MRWDYPFVLPNWLKAWWSVFSKGLSASILSVSDGEELIGIAPLVVHGERACFIGDRDVCDYMDFIVAPGKGQEFCSILLNHLRQRGVTWLDLGPVRPDSTAFTHLMDHEKGMDWEVSCEQEDVSYELELPRSWDEFLGVLPGKQRHEIRRKLRRLHEAGDARYRLVESEEGVEEEIEDFLRLFRSNRPDKAAFMTGQMASFFRSLAESMAKDHILKLFFLDLDKRPVAAVMCFDYNSTTYLYNNGYDRDYSSLNVALISKVLNIKAGIERGMERYDFLKGDEDYKHQLGGKRVPLYRCQARLRK
ncbi:MAG: GNAT family N-acetyltransferase [Pseudomonadota bacterium]